jgi:hypothetical protein
VRAAGPGALPQKGGNLRFPELGVTFAAKSFAAIAFDPQLSHCMDAAERKPSEGHRISVAAYTPRLVRPRSCLPKQALAC